MNFYARTKSMYDVILRAVKEVPITTTITTIVLVVVVIVVS